MDLNEYKEIITGAINNEIEAQEFYEDAARKLTDPYLREMFGKFAAEEKKHREILKKIFTSERIEQYFNEDRDYRVAETVDTPSLPSVFPRELRQLSHEIQLPLKAVSMVKVGDVLGFHTVIGEKKTGVAKASRFQSSRTRSCRRLDRNVDL